MQHSPAVHLSFVLLFALLLLQLARAKKNSTADDDESRSQRCQKAKDFVNRLNGQQIGDGKWKAVYRERFASMAISDRKRMQGLINVPLVPRSAASNSSLLLSPNSTNGASSARRRKRATSCSYSYAFDSRTAWPGCAAVINSVRDQSGCGSCWAVATASAFTDRHCIQRAKAGLSTSATNASNFFSDADVLSCSPSSYGCNGGSPYYAWNYIKSTGVVTGTNYTWSSGCKPYPFAPNSNSVFTAPACSAACTNSKWTSGYGADKRKATWTGYMQSSSSTVAKIQAEIKANGTVVASMDVYEDFYYYSSGVYTRTSSSYQGGHAIRLLGWGTQTCTDGTSTEFWLAANTWNTDWGMKGFFLIKRGNDEVRIESMGIFYGTPKI